MSSSAVVLRWGQERARAGPWHGDSRVAYLAASGDGLPASPEFVRRCIEKLSSEGFASVLTGAMSPAEQQGFLAAGFGVERHLHLLSLDLRMPLPEVERPRMIARPNRGQRAEALSVDAAAFSEFWRFDEQGLNEALKATPSTRFRVAIPDDGTRRVVGYGICGRTGLRGFVQRLAVRPEAQRRGIGRVLLLDGLHWMRRRGVTSAAVNTQIDNDAALELYLSVGFTQHLTGLSVLSMELA